MEKISDKKIDNAVKAFDAIEKQVEKYQLSQLLALDVFWHSISQFIANFGETSKEVFLCYIKRELGFELVRVY